MTCLSGIPSGQGWAFWPRHGQKDHLVCHGLVRTAHRLAEQAEQQADMAEQAEQGTQPTPTEPEEDEGMH